MDVTEPREFIEQSSSEGAHSFSDIQKFFKIIWDLEVYYHFHQDLSPDSTLSQINPVQESPSYFWKIHFNIIPPFSHRSFSPAFLTKNPVGNSLLFHDMLLSQPFSLLALSSKD